MKFVLQMLESCKNRAGEEGKRPHNVVFAGSAARRRAEKQGQTCTLRIGTAAAVWGVLLPADSARKHTWHPQAVRLYRKF